VVTAQKERTSKERERVKRQHKDVDRRVPRAKINENTHPSHPLFSSYTGFTHPDGEVGQQIVGKTEDTARKKNRGDSKESELKMASSIRKPSQQQRSN